jgi:hypothetical protein
MACKHFHRKSQLVAHVADATVWLMRRYILLSVVVNELEKLARGKFVESRQLRLIMM